MKSFALDQIQSAAESLKTRFEPLTSFAQPFVDIVTVSLNFFLHLKFLYFFIFLNIFMYIIYFIYAVNVVILYILIYIVYFCSFIFFKVFIIV